MGFLCAGFGRRRDPAAFFATTGCWDAFNLVTEVASIALLLVYLSPNASICAFVRKYHPHRYRPFLHKVLPIINIVAGIGYIVSQFFPPPDVLDIICIVVFAVYCLIGGVVVYRSNVDLETVAAC
jgi:amino acid transporter